MPLEDGISFRENAPQMSRTLIKSKTGFGSATDGARDPRSLSVQVFLPRNQGLLHNGTVRHKT